MVTLIEHGDLFASRAAAIANPVNCVGVMGKGLALAFRRRYPEIMEPYRRACETRMLRPGRPVLLTRTNRPHILLFPTKDHWRQRSNAEDILAGVARLGELLPKWPVGSLAVPALGCGEGGLDWQRFSPALTEALETLGIDVELYAPH